MLFGFVIRNNEIVSPWIMEEIIRRILEEGDKDRK